MENFLKENQNQEALQSALKAAVGFGNLQMTKLAIQSGADLSLATCELKKAIYNIDILNELIANHWDVNCRDKWGYTPLMDIADISRPFDPWLRQGIFIRQPGDPVEITKILLKAGADINARDTQQENALYKTLEHNNTDIAQILLEHGADPNINFKDDTQRGSTLMEAISWYGLTYDPTMVNLLIINGADVNWRDPTDYDLTCSASTFSDCPFAGYTALSFAKKEGYETIVKMLIQHGAKD